jgi:hypothetical protein
VEGRNVARAAGLATLVLPSTPCDPTEVGESWACWRSRGYEIVVGSDGSGCMMGASIRKGSGP